MNINQTKQFINEDKVRNLFEKLYGKDERYYIGYSV